MIALIDYGMGNIRSIQKHFQKMDLDSLSSSDPNVIKEAKKLILPGVGHFTHGMESLRKLGLVDILNYMVLEKKVLILGICLGMQLFTQWGEEGGHAGLGWISGKTKKFQFGNMFPLLKVPHIGWNNLEIVGSSPVLADIQADNHFYFVHSYHVVCDNPDNVIAQTTYGYSFPSVIQKDNILGTQFHPEKSHDAGRQLIKNFLEME